MIELSIGHLRASEIHALISRGTSYTVQVGSIEYAINEADYNLLVSQIDFIKRRA